MILGLPPSSWVLLLASLGLGLTISLVFYFRHRWDPGGPDEEETAGEPDELKPRQDV